MKQKQPARVGRRLAAIVAADVAGYSRLMGLDEVGTARTLREHRKITDALVAKHGGRLVKTTGDGVLLEFSSVVDAVECAVAAQAVMAQRNEGIPRDRRMLFRIGINLGDILIEGDDILGDGVNIAARLEGIAEPGGICISSSAYDQVRGKVAVEFADLGEQRLKNIDRPVRVYAAGPRGHHRMVAPDVLPSDSEAQKPLPLPDKPSIAVLPFQNMSGDPEQDYFADGMVEDIITALSHFSELFVIARNSSFTYKGRAVDVKQVGCELGVRYVLEGSVRKAGNRVRITGQLIDAAMGTHIWADRFDRPLDDMFELQDEVTMSVVGAIAPKLQQAEIERAKRKPTDRLDAYDYYLRGIASLHHWTKDGCEGAKRLFQKAFELDSEFGGAYGAAARCQVWRHANRWISRAEVDAAMQLAERAVLYGSKEAAALAAAGFAFAYIARDLDSAVSLIDRALAMNPNMATAWHFSCWIRAWNGSPDLALTHERRAMRLSPLDPLFGQMQAAAGLAELFAGRFGDASSWALRSTLALPNWPLALGIAAASSALAGRMEEAQSALARLLQLNPAIKPSDLTSFMPLRRPEDCARFEAGLRLAGLSE
jgi:TolB-like protein/class 3 adenylate cyclase